MTNPYDAAFSQARLKTYRIGTSSEEEVIRHYLWNIALSEALFPALALLEVTLRNRVDAAFSLVEPNWLNPNWSGWRPYRYKLPDRRIVYRNLELQSLSQARTKFRDSARGKLIADPVSMLHQRLEKIRRIRNRVFHHEPLFNRKHLRETYQDLTETLYWMSPSAHELLSRLDRFKTVLDQAP